MSDRHEDQLMELLRQLSHIDYIKPGTFPNIDLYMDQVTTFMNEHLTHSKIKEDDKILTKTMINNYAKNDLLPPPVNKKYSKEHMIVLTFIYYFKSILSISEIQDMLGPLTERFFDPEDNPGHVTMEDVYDGIYAAIKSQLSTISKDITVKLDAEREHFTNVKNSEDREFLQTFSMICMLGFDVFLKKQIIESLVDSISPKAPKAPGTSKKTDKTPTKKGL